MGKDLISMGKFYSSYISKHFAQSSAGPSANPSKVATSQGSSRGAGGPVVVVVSFENIKWLYTQTSVPGNAEASQ